MNKQAVKPALLNTFALFALLAVSAAPGLYAADSEPVTVTVGKMQVVNTPFAITGFRVADMAVVKAEKVEARQLRVLGLKAGATDVQVTGAGGITSIFAITVVENIKAVYSALLKDLDSVPEVDLSISMGRVMIRGEVSSIKNWNLLQKVIRLYPGSVVNMGTFQPTPEVLLSLKSSLEKSGFSVVQPKGKEPIESGTISLQYSGNTIFIGGKVFSPADVAKIKEIIGAESWLYIPGTEKEKKGDTRVKAVINTSVLPVMLELGVVFVGVTFEESTQFGVNLAKAGLIVLDSTSAALHGEVDKRRWFTGGYTINSGLQGVLKLFGGRGPGRFRTAGHMTFKSDSPNWRTYHSGGTLKVRTATETTVGLSDIDYGLIMKVKGGLADSKTASLDVNLELSYPLPVGTDYDIKKNSIDSSVLCPLGHTMVMGGMHGLLEQSSKEGVPFLKSIPIISLFFSERAKQKQDSRVLILLNPNMLRASRPSKPVSDETISTEQDALKPIDQLDKEERRKKRRKFFFF